MAEYKDIKEWAYRELYGFTPEIEEQMRQEYKGPKNRCPFCGAELPQSENVTLENDGTYSAGNLYECDPEKNAECRKTGCYINGGECRHTTHAEYAKEDRDGI